MSKLKEKIINEIKKIYDPEIPVNIYELGLIYKIEVIEEKKVNKWYKIFEKISNFSVVFAIIVFDLKEEISS